ncbi:hypothetical protein BH23GEM9_BH23GEM9_22610 [soil metagenome]
MLIPLTVRERIRRLPAYEFVRAARERAQLKEFDQLLDRIGAAPVPAAATRPRLAASGTPGGARRDVPGPDFGIVAYGARDWEANGLWQSFEEIGPFSLWEYRAPGAIPPVRDAAYRARLAAAFLAHLETVEQQFAVHCVFFYASAEHIDVGLLAELRQRGIWTVVMSLDDKHQFVRPIDAATGEPLQLLLSRHCDLYWTSWKTGTRLIYAHGGNPWYAPAAAHPRFYRPVPVHRDLQVAFIGQAYGARGALVRYLRKRGFSVATHGPGWPGGFLPFDRVIETVSRSQVVMGVGGVGFTGEINHLKGRDFEFPMCGAVYLTSFNSELADHFAIGDEILCYASPRECADVLHWILGDEDAAESIRTAVRARSLREHTWGHRLRAMLSVLTDRDVKPDCA